MSRVGLLCRSGKARPRPHSRRRVRIDSGDRADHGTPVMRARRPVVAILIVIALASVSVAVPAAETQRRMSHAMDPDGGNDPTGYQTGILAVCSGPSILAARSTSPVSPPLAMTLRFRHYGDAARTWHDATPAGLGVRGRVALYDLLRVYRV